MSLQQSEVRESHLTLVKNELVPVFEFDGKLEVSSDELYTGLGVKKDYSSWIKAQIEKLDLVKGVDYRSLTQKVERAVGASIKRVYYFPIDIAKEIAMISQTKAGKVIRKYFIEVEKEYRQAHQENPLIGKSPIELLEYSVIELKRKELIIQEQALEIVEDKKFMNLQGEIVDKLANKVEEDKPKVEVYEKIINSTGLMEIGQVAKTINWMVKTFFKQLKDDGFLRWNNEPYAEYINRGYFQTKTTTFMKNGQKQIYIKPLVTAKGLDFLAKKYAA